MGRVGKLALVLLLAHATTATTIAGELVKSEIKDIVSSYLTGPEFTMKIVSIVQAAVQHEVAAALASAAPPSSSRRLVEASTGVVCSMHSCGDTEACSAWNKDIDDVARLLFCSHRRKAMIAIDPGAHIAHFYVCLLTG